MPMTQEQYADQVASLMTHYLRTVDGGDKDLGLYIAEKMRGLYLEIHPDTTRDDVIVASGVGICTAVRTYEAAYEKRHTSEDKTALSIDTAGRMPLLSNSNTPMVYYSYVWNNKQYVPATITTLQPLVPDETVEFGPMPLTQGA